ncbi:MULTISPECIES: hypothetical protein [Streptomyces]|uniref:Secreted protein n=1 Tax=Streptomyces thermoviolaceus subsp. thermoviolaceus TaxID=66860 RepID=A0ABX0YXC1_STRTL|nr:MULTISPECIES: hypothetical protein [Streptomyces]WTD46764.1 hypothetical protein OG899_04105 [Streptomyces thermoviolaceus]NJP15665.1 hypothetical protein [Streptomyces thermoviolaceus subsp. thermoviolaceus]RSR96320.1 hypothetical protein EF917_23920 [Streptomyces sp. WAC00469]GGV83614.1 hypothetical protein GCM10010499_50950 [Streptomyces thermoviolaceus subsp. apingens]GHA95827.1 hypothetical protein GCM10010512_29260 [Streptomyces thermoviolaceus subsp. thermoviolaceus]
MKEPRKPSPGAGAGLRRLVPPPALCGFLLLLALVFTVSYAVGAAAGPVAPGMHRSGTGGDAGRDGDTDRGDTHDMGDMGGMDHGSGG